MKINIGTMTITPKIKCIPFLKPPISLFFTADTTSNNIKIGKDRSNIAASIAEIYSAPTN